MSVGWTRRLRTAWLVALCGIAPPAWAEAGGGEAGPEAYTFERFVAEVEATHPLMRAARASIETFEAKMRQADWAYFPSFTLEGGATITPKITGDALKSESDWGTVGYFFSVKLSMVQPIYTFGKIAALQRAAAHGVDVGRAQVDTARWELRLRAAQAYTGKLLSDELAAIISEGHKWIDKADERMQRLKDEDSVDYDQQEHLRLKTRVADFYLLAAENALLKSRSEEGLRVLLSREPGQPVTLVAGSLEPTAYKLLEADRYVELAMQRQPEMMQARAGLRAQRDLASAKEAELWPDLVVVGTVGARTANEVVDIDSSFANDPFNGTTAAAALALRWKLDVPQRLFRAEEERAKAIRAEHQVDVAEDLLEVRVRELHQDLTNKAELLHHLRSSQKAAQGWLNATWDTYSAGFGGFRDVMDALVQFYSKKFGYLQAVFEHNVTVVRLSQAVGVDIREATAPEAK